MSFGVVVAGAVKPLWAEGYTHVHSPRGCYVLYAEKKLPWNMRYRCRIKHLFMQKDFSHIPYTILYMGVLFNVLGDKGWNGCIIIFIVCEFSSRFIFTVLYFVQAKKKETTSSGGSHHNHLWFHFRPENFIFPLRRSVFVAGLGNICRRYYVRMKSLW